MKNRAGYYKTNLSGEMAYKSFVPNSLPPVPPVELTKDIIALLVKANSQLAVLESVATRIPNVELFVSMYVQPSTLPQVPLPDWWMQAFLYKHPIPAETGPLPTKLISMFCTRELEIRRLREPPYFR